MGKLTEIPKISTSPVEKLQGNDTIIAENSNQPCNLRPVPAAGRTGKKRGTVGSMGQKASFNLVGNEEFEYIMEVFGRCTDDYLFLLDLDKNEYLSLIHI